MCPPVSHKIYSGSHIFLNSSTVFVTSFKDTAAPLQAAIFINGIKYSLSLDLGNTSKDNVSLLLNIQHLEHGFIHRQLELNVEIITFISKTALELTGIIPKTALFRHTTKDLV